MTDDPFDPADGERGKRDGMDRAWRGADPEWKRIILICVLEVAKRKPYFTADDVERYRLANYPNHTTHEHRALGPIMLEAAVLEYCVKTQDWVESTQRINHRRPMRVWWSLAYQGRKRYYRPPPRKPLDPRQISLFEEIGE
jgi:hypothetical protein